MPKCPLAFCLALIPVTAPAWAQSAPESAPSENATPVAAPTATPAPASTTVPRAPLAPASDPVTAPAPQAPAPSMVAGAPERPFAPSFSYAADISFLYADRLARPAISNPYRSTIMASAPLAAATPKEGTRTLGLRAFSLTTHWEFVRQSALVVTFRPDATLRRNAANHDESREVDTRSGQVYRSLPEVKLLDTYRIELNPSTDSVFAFGVFREVAPWETAYAPVLDFGLRVLFPEKFFGAHLAWRLEHAALPMAGGTFSPSTRLSLFLYEGPDDRAETLAPSQESYDTAPAAKDPNHGGAIVLSHAFGPETFVGATAGFDEKRVDDAKLANVYGGVSGSWGSAVGALPYKLAADLRYSRDAWRNAPDGRRSLVQQSASLTGSLGFTPRQWLLAGFHYGTSERHQAADAREKFLVRGFQTDVGYQLALTAATDVKAVVTDERRTNHSRGETTDGFTGAHGSRRRLNRIGVEIRHAFNGI